MCAMEYASVEGIQRVLGVKELRCFSRRDGLASAYCCTHGNGGQENAEALLIAKALGIQLPEEALPLRGRVLFLGPAVGKYSNL